MPFRMAIRDAKAQGMMAAYNAVNGIPCAVNPFLKNVVIQDWGHDGIICTDGGAMENLVTEHKRYSKLEEAAADCVKSGINQFLDRFEEPVRTALGQEILSDSQMDESLRGVFRVMIRLGMIDPPEMVPYRNVGKELPWESVEHKTLALRAARESIVLLKNKGRLLPLDAGKIRSLAVIGPYADMVISDWYGGDAPYRISPLEGIQKRLGEGVRVQFAQDNTGGAAEKLARSCDAAIVCAGNHPLGNGGWGKRDSTAEGKESLDRESMDLRQEELIKKVLHANPRTIVALISSFPFTMTWTVDHVPAILHMAHSGQESGTALAEALFGDVNPGGRLVETWPRSIDQLPPMMDYDIRHGHTYLYFKGEPLFPFGYGLSYTNFKYSNLKMNTTSVKTNGQINVTFELINSGSRPGDEVVQLYLKYMDSKIQRPNKELKGFQRVFLEPGKTKEIQFAVKASDLAYWRENKERPLDPAQGSWNVEPGRVQIQVGSSSKDIHLKSEFLITN